MRPFVIFGSGGLGRELLGWIADSSPETRHRLQVAAFITDLESNNSKCHGVPVLHLDQWTGTAPRFIVGVADPTHKKRIARSLEKRGWEPETFIHHSAAIGIASQIGPGTVICPRCCISTDSVIGEHVLVNSASDIGHDATVGSFSSLLGAVSVNGNVILGEGVLCGAGSMIFPGKKIGNWAKIGLGSVVLRNVPDHATMFGNPAQRIDN